MLYAADLDPAGGKHDRGFLTRVFRLSLEYNRGFGIGSRIGGSFAAAYGWIQGSAWHRHDRFLFNIESIRVSDWDRRRWRPRQKLTAMTSANEQPCEIPGSSRYSDIADERDEQNEEPVWFSIARDESESPRTGADLTFVSMSRHCEFKWGHFAGRPCAE